MKPSIYKNGNMWVVRWRFHALGVTRMVWCGSFETAMDEALNPCTEVRLLANAEKQVTALAHMLPRSIFEREAASLGTF